MENLLFLGVPILKHFTVDCENEHEVHLNQQMSGVICSGIAF